VVADDSVWVRFSDGHEEAFDLAHLSRTLGLPDDLPEPLAWRAESGPPRAHHWEAVRSEPKAFRDALADFLTFGTIVVIGVPNESAAVLTVGERFGNVRDTNFGRMFDVRSVPNPNDLAYTAIPLGPHTDNPYRDPTPGIQLLHCLVNETTGGLSTLVDAIAVTDRLREEDPEGFRMLAEVPVQFRFRDARSRRPGHRARLQPAPRLPAADVARRHPYLPAGARTTRRAARRPRVRGAVHAAGR
jgi:gamma-butyrobetaine dioxygenase